MGKFSKERGLNLKGQRFGRLIAKQVVRKNGIRHWVCECDCGGSATVATNNLMNGHTQSCGCILRKHDMSYTRFYSSWHAMKTRILNKNHVRHANYASKNITIYKSWLSFDKFFDDMYLSFKKHSAKHGEKNTTLDRINNDGNYEPSNCRWATYKVQANNRSNNI